MREKSMKFNQKPWIYGVAGLAAAFGIACSEDDHDHDHEGEHGDEELEAEACAHLANGPYAAITAGSATDTDLPSAAIEHTSVDITLIGGEGGNVGFVSFAAEADGDYVFFLDADVGFMMFDGTGNAVEIEATEIGSEACTDIAVSHTLELAVGTYTISLGPAEATEVSMVHEMAGEGHDHEGEDHEGDDHEGDDHEGSGDEG